MTVRDFLAGHRLAAGDRFATTVRLKPATTDETNVPPVSSKPDVSKGS
jgi:hypothetical protein